MIETRFPPKLRPCSAGLPWGRFSTVPQASAPQPQASLHSPAETSSQGGGAQLHHPLMILSQEAFAAAPGAAPAGLPGYIHAALWRHIMSCGNWC